MTDARPSAQAIFEPDRLQLDERGSENPAEPMHTELCVHCQALVFNERDHSDTLEDHGYRLVWDEDGQLQLETDNRPLAPAPSLRFRSAGTDIRLRTQLIRKDIIPSFPSITATAEAGCHFCRCLLSSTLRDRCTQGATRLRDTNSTERPLAIEFFYTWNRSSFGVRWLVASATIDNLPSASVLECFLVEADLDKPCAKVLGIPTKTFLPNWSFDEKLAVMRGWIDSCENSCHLETLGRTLPTRLLDLGSSQGSDQGVRLIYSKDIPRCIERKYSALSHCWGPPDLPPLKTKMDCLNKMLRNIPFESLPANYRDAVRVSRGLGIDYLWIDSLCIVQDSAEDWEAESLRMVDVYQNAHVTLIVATGNCSHDGFLHPKANDIVRIPYVSSLPCSPTKDTYYLRQDYDTSHDIQNSPWNSRGWTFQEGAFSTRRLYFTQNTISFSCDRHLRLLDGTRVPAHGILTADLSPKRPESWYDYYRWSTLTELYSQRQLTCQQDQLPAISAWAQFMSQKINDRYLAGLWEGDLLHGLLWSCEVIPSTQTLAERIKSTMKENFVAPSWSWASQTRGVNYELRGTAETRLCEIFNVEVWPLGSNLFGRLKSGHMVIAGALRPLPVTPIHKAKNLFQSTLDDSYRVEYFMDWWEKRMDVTPGQEIERGIVHDVKMLLLTHCRPINHTFTPYACGLLVLPTGTDEEYWRVGMFRIQLEWEDEELAIPGFDCLWSTIKIV